MIPHFEDGPPNVPARRYKDVIDEMSAICMEIRAKNIRDEFAKRMRQTMRGLPFQVHYGVMQQHAQHFTSFDKALEFFVDHVEDDFAPLLVGAFHDGERAGLTADESDAVAAALELRTPRNARRA